MIFLILSTSNASRGQTVTDASLERKASARRAADQLGVENLIFGDFPDNKFDTLPHLEITQKIESVVVEFKPSVVYTHHGGDVSRDHRLTFESAIAATRPFPGQSVKRMLTFEVRSSTDWVVDGGSFHQFQPNTWIPLDDWAVQQKMAAIAEYPQEMHAHPHSRSLQAVRDLMAHRGAQVGTDAAEAFTLMRSVEIA